jgi:primosomal protein N'
MHVISVIPLKRGINADTLSYYAKDAYVTGTIVEIPVRGKMCRGLVVRSETVSAHKTTLKAASFSLRRLPAQTSTAAVSPALVQTAYDLQTHYAANLGAILYHLLPTEIRNGDITPPRHRTEPHEEDTTPQTLHATTQDRYITYQSHVRTMFARGGSTLFVVPTTAHIGSAKHELALGIQDRVVVLSRQDTPRQRREAFATVEQSSAPLLIITTPADAYIERADIKSIVIEHAAHTQYHTRTRPYLDHRVSLRTLARHAGCNIILGDTVLRTEDEYARREDRIQSYNEPPKRLVFPARLRCIEQPAHTSKNEPFALFADETVRRVRTVLNRRENVFLYAARQGLAPVVACFDCGNILRCPDSGTPYSLHRTYDKSGNESRWFVDSSSGRRTRAADVCDQCGSWRLRERGVGIQHIADCIPDYFPNTPVIHFDADTARTKRKIAQLSTRMREAKGAIILGTAVALPYLPTNLTTSCVTSYEATSSIPSWRADEILFRLLLELREKNSNEVIIQHRTELGPVVTHATRGALEHFYTEEIELREMLQYPPFSVLVLCTWQGPRQSVQAIEVELHNALQAYNPLIYSHPLSNQKKARRHALLRIPAHHWPNQELQSILRGLNPGVSVQINPDRIV